MVGGRSDCDGRINILWIDGLDSVEPLVHCSKQLIGYQCIPEKKMRSQLRRESTDIKSEGRDSPLPS